MWTAILPFLQAVGLKPERYAKQFTREQVERRLEQAVPAVVEALERDRLAKDDRIAPNLSRLPLIKAATFHTLKQAMPFKRGAGRVADVLRDRHLHEVTAMVTPVIDADTPASEVVRLVNRALIERLF